MNFDTLLRGREFWSAKELMALGLFKSKSTIWHVVRRGHLEAIMSSDRVRVITRESIVKYLKSLNTEQK